MMTFLLAAQILISQPGITVQAPPPPAPAVAAEILRTSPGISNRTGWHPVPDEPRGPRVVFVPTPTTPAPAVPAPSTESDRARAIRMGIPGEYTPLEWAILHSGAGK